MKTIVTHIYLDLDAVTSCWLVKRYMPNWEEASITFVPAGTTLNGKDPDENPDIIHVDTGLGKFDHHQTDEYTSAAKLVFSYLGKNFYIPENIIEPLEKLVHHVTDIDHFDEVNYPDPTSDRYDFMLSQIIDGLNSTVKDANKVIDCLFISLDAVLQLLKNKIKAQKEVKKGYVFDSKWGKTLALETNIEDSLKLALKSGYSLVIRKDPEKGNLRIKTLPKKELDLTPIYTRLKKLDSKATWFLHSSKNMLLNGSSKVPTSIPTTLPLKKVIEIIKEI